MTILVAGAGGFIGGHLVKRLLEDEQSVRAYDIKPRHQWHQIHNDADNYPGQDLQHLGTCYGAIRGCEQVYNLAADMGGMGFIENHKADCMLSVLINTHLLKVSRSTIERFFYASSACVYAAGKQTNTAVTALAEADAYPAEPEDGYGWEKLFSERMCRHFTEDYGLETRVARYHNVYGPDGTWDGGREKAPAALCRKIALAQLTGKHEIEIWGDGEQTRSFMYVNDCVEGTLRLMESDVDEPINIGSSELVSINELVTIIEDIAGINVERHYKLDAPLGVRGRNSDNTMIQSELDWEPSIMLRDGLAKTYAWVHNQVEERMRKAT